MAFIEEIYEHPVALKRFIGKYFKEEPAEAKALKQLIEEKNINRYVFTGMGSSLFASYISCNLLRQNGIEAYAFETNEFNKYGTNIIDERTLVVAVSQSGECKEILKFLNGNESNTNIVAVTNYVENTLAKKTSIVFDICAGVEKFSASKTYTNTIAVLIYLAYLIGKKNVTEIENVYSESLKVMESVLEDCSKNIDEMCNFFGDAKYIAAIGSGFSFSTASQCELIIQEAGKILSSAYTTGQFTHGPNEITDDKYNAIIFDFDEKMTDYTDRIINDILSCGGKTLVITNRNLNIKATNAYTFMIDFKNSVMSPILEIIPVEMLINHIGLKRNLQPGLLKKVVK